MVDRNQQKESLRRGVLSAVMLLWNGVTQIETISISVCCAVAPLFLPLQSCFSYFDLQHLSRMKYLLHVVIKLFLNMTFQADLCGHHLKLL